MTQSLNDESRKHIEQVAGEALAQLESIAETAKSKLHDGRTLGSDALASINTMTSSSAIQRLDQISQANRESYQVLVAEPAIARVVVADEEGEEKTYYICRTTPVSGFPNLASYRAPVGRLASLAIGAEFTLPNGTVVEVLERAQLRPNALADGWDSRDTVVEAEHFGPFTIESLRALLTEVAGEEVTEDILGQLLAEETVKANIIDGVRRSVITKMGLRDQRTRHRDALNLPAGKTKPAFAQRRLQAIRQGTHKLGRTGLFKGLPQLFITRLRGSQTQAIGNGPHG